MEFDHAGIATTDLNHLVDVYETVLDADVVHEETFDGMEIAFLDLGNGYFELLEPLPDSDGAIARYLSQNGTGIHHLAMRTDVEVALETARENDIKLIDEEPREGAMGHEVAFLHPRSTGGVLIEFVEH